MRRRAASSHGDYIRMVDKTLDTQGLNCPLPLLKLRKAIQDVPIGGTLEVLASHQGAMEDFESFCEQTKQQMLETSQTGGVCRVLIKRLV